MNTLTIPQTITKGEELVIIPRKKYEEFLRLEVRIPKTRVRFHTELDKDLDKAIAEYRRGEYYGPFDNVKDLMKSLKSKK